MSAFLVVAVASIATATAAMLVTALAARRAGRVSVVDTTWGLALTAIALACALLGDAAPARRWLLLAMVAVWGLRLSWHIHRRNRGQAEDRRYAAQLAGASYADVVRRVYVVQGLALLLVSFPVQVAAVRPVSAQTLLWLGVAVWVVGFLVEAVGDAQLAAYRRDPSRGPVLDRGLWAWTRHPNYFGDACVWWGVWLAAGAASGWLPGLLTVAAPLAMTHYLVFVTGARPLEAHLMERPAYRAYAGRTSMFLPRRPRP